MKNRKSGFASKRFTLRYFFVIAAIMALGVFIESCHNPVMERWWDDPPTVFTPPPVGGRGENFGVVIFNTNGGSPHPQALTILWGGIVGRLRPLSRGGDGFIGWFDERGEPWDVETRQVRSRDDADGDGFIVLTARWNTAPLAPNPPPDPPPTPIPPPVVDPPPVTEPPPEPPPPVPPLSVNFVVKFAPNYPTNLDLPDQIIAAGGKVVEPATIVTGDGRALAGWYTDPNFSPFTLWNFATDVVNSHMVLYARYSYQTRTIHLEPNGGTRADGVTQLTRVNFTIFIPDSGGGGKIIDPGPLVREGHTFGGWYTDPGFHPSALWNFATSRVTEPDEDPGRGDYFYLFAQWVPNIYLVTFNSSGGIPAMVTVAVSHGERIDRPAAIRNPGKVLTGWYINQNFTGEPWDFNSAVTFSMTLYAMWEDTVYIVRFHSGNPNGAPPHMIHINNWPAEQRVSSGGTVIEPFMLPLPSADQNTGWSFYNWYYHPNPGINDPGRVNNADFRDALQPWDFSSGTVGDDVTVEELDGAHRVLNLYARWVPPVTGMVWVPRGRFNMGDSGVSGSPAAYHAFPTRIVTVDGFYISRTEVTQAQYRNLMTGRIPNPAPSNKTGNSDNNPVERVSWFDAVYFLHWLTETSDEPNLHHVFDISSIRRAGDGGAQVPTTTIIGSISEAAVEIRAANRLPNGFPNGYRLLTEAEWEFAARGGHGSPNNFMYAGSNSAEAVAWFIDTVKTMPTGATQAVGTKAPNALGIFDMSGNVSEWVWDWFASYKEIIGAHPSVEAYSNPKGPLAGSERARRGGAWNNAAGNVRSVVRNSANPTDANWVIGFRVARGPSEVW